MFLRQRPSGLRSVFGLIAHRFGEDANPMLAEALVLLLNKEMLRPCDSQDNPVEGFTDSGAQVGKIMMIPSPGVDEIALLNGQKGLLRLDVAGNVIAPAAKQVD